MKALCFLAAFLFMLLSITPSYAGSCSAGGFLGIGTCCQVTCTPPQTPKCRKTGLFSCECFCQPGSPSALTIPSLTTQQLADANSFAQFSFGYGTPGMHDLGEASDEVLLAVDSGDDNWYDAAEHAWQAVWDGLSAQEQADANAFRESLGYHD